MVCHSLLQWTTFCQTSPPWPARLGWPHTAWLSFIELDQAVVHVIGLTSFLWLWFQCVCPLMPSRSTYRLTWVSLTLDVGYLFVAESRVLITGIPTKGSLTSYRIELGSALRSRSKVDLLPPGCVRERTAFIAGYGGRRWGSSIPNCFLQQLHHLHSNNFWFPLILASACNFCLFDQFLLRSHCGDENLENWGIMKFGGSSCRAVLPLKAQYLGLSSVMNMFRNWLWWWFHNSEYTNILRAKELYTWKDLSLWIILQ